MLEARLLVKLVEAKTMWETPPHYTNDAQDAIRDATSMAVDTEWEDRLDRVLNPEYNLPFEQLQAQFLKDHPQVTESDLIDHNHPACIEFHEVCQSADKQYSDHVIMCLDSLINWLCTAIGDKVHRRNLQIADLKRSIQVTERSLERLMSKPPTK